MRELVLGLICAGLIGWGLFIESLFRIRKMRKRMIGMEKEILELRRKHDQNVQEIEKLTGSVITLKKSVAQLIAGIKRMDNNFKIDEPNDTDSKL